MNTNILNQQIKIANAILTNSNIFTRKEQLKLIAEIPADIRLTARVDRLVRKYTCFDGISNLLAAKGNYRPTLYTNAASRVQDREELKLIADYYDACMAQNGDSRRAYRV